MTKNHNAVYRLLVLLTILAASILIFFGCDLPTRPYQLQTPDTEDYMIGRLVQTNDDVEPVRILAKPGKSSGSITTFYENDNYNRSLEVPQAAGKYTVTFNVAAVPGWSAERDLPAGILEVNGKPTPKGSHYTVKNLQQLRDSPTEITIEPNMQDNGSTPPAVRTVHYIGNGSALSSEKVQNFRNVNSRADIPQEVGTYSVYFDVGEENGWNPATLLFAGDLRVVEHRTTPVAGQFIADSLVQIVGSTKSVTVRPGDGIPASDGAITVKYNGSTDRPTGKGRYKVTFDIAASGIWNEANDLPLGDLHIVDPDSGAVWILADTSTFGTSTIRSIAFGAGKFVAVGDHGKMAYSTDGETWTAIDSTATTFGYTGRINSIIWESNSFVAAGWDGTRGRIAQSADGITWRDLQSPTWPVDKIGSDANSKALQNLTEEISFVVPHIQSGMILAITANGRTASRRPNDKWWGGNFGSKVNGAARYGYGGNGADKGRWFMVADSGRLTWQNGADGGSSPGTNMWNTNNNPFGTSNINGIKTFPTSSSPTIVVAWGNNGKLAFSDDKTNNNANNASYWKAGGVALGGKDIYDLTFNTNRNRYVAVGSAGSISYSDNMLQTWKDGNNVFHSSRINAVTYGVIDGTETFVAVGEGGRIAFSKSK